MGEGGQPAIWQEKAENEEGEAVLKEQWACIFESSA